MQTFVPIIAEPDSGQSVPRIRVGLIPAGGTKAIAAIAALDDQAAYLYAELCFHHEPRDRWVHLPFPLQQRIDQDLWNGALARLQVANLITVTLEASLSK